MKINEIIVSDRIRKDLGDIAELAADIQANGLINPVVVDDQGRLLAGERRLEAVKSLGWEDVPVTVMQTRDEEHALAIEVSENEVRKEFSRAERAECMKRQLEVEMAKAKERQESGANQYTESLRPNSDEGGRADEITAKEFGIGKDTLRKEIAIAEHQEDMDPADFADWDEGRLSTNKAYQLLKEQLRKAQEETDEVKRQLHSERVESIKEKKQHQEEIDDLQKASKELAESNARAKSQMADEIEELKGQLEEARAAEPQVVEKIVEKIPDDYEFLKYTCKRSEREQEELRQRNMQSSKKIQELEAQLGRDKLLRDADLDVQTFTTVTYDYIRRYGGHVWSFEQLANLSEPVRLDLVKAVKTLNAFTVALVQNLEGGNLE